MSYLLFKDIVTYNLFTYKSYKHIGFGIKFTSRFDMPLNQIIRKLWQKYPKLCATVESILLVFPSSYMLESGFSHVLYLLRKQWSTLNIEHDDLQLKYTNQQPSVSDLLSVHQAHLKRIKKLMVCLHSQFSDYFLI